jgi:hypothetical protein
LTAGTAGPEGFVVGLELLDILNDAFHVVFGLVTCHARSVFVLGEAGEGAVCGLAAVY